MTPKTETYTPAYSSRDDTKSYFAMGWIPDRMSAAELEKRGYSRSNASILYSSLRSLGLYDEEGKLVEHEDLLALGAKDANIRRDAFKRVVNRVYDDLLKEIPIDEANVENIAYYFRRKRAADSVSKKAARLFLWLSEQAGLRNPEEVSKTESKVRKDSTQESRNAVKPSEKSKSNSNELSGKALVLRTILDTMRIHGNSSDIVELAKIASELGREIDAENKNHHRDDTPEPSDKKSTIDNRAMQGGD